MLDLSRYFLHFHLLLLLLQRINGNAFKNFQNTLGVQATTKKIIKLNFFRFKARRIGKPIGMHDGDGGGPIVNFLKTCFIGVASFGALDYATVGGSTVFTRADYFSEWILNSYQT